MTAATGKRMEIGLVLQGGGALGAYEYGGITALLNLMETAKANGPRYCAEGRHRRFDWRRQRGVFGRRQGLERCARPVRRPVE